MGDTPPVRSSINRCEHGDRLLDLPGAHPEPHRDIGIDPALTNQREDLLLADGETRRHRVIAHNARDRTTAVSGRYAVALPPPSDGCVSNG